MYLPLEVMSACAVLAVVDNRSLSEAAREREEKQKAELQQRAKERGRVRAKVLQLETEVAELESRLGYVGLDKSMMKSIVARMSHWEDCVFNTLTFALCVQVPAQCQCGPAVAHRGGAGGGCRGDGR